MRTSPLMAMALPASRVAVGMVITLVPAVRTRPPAAVKARLAGSKKGSGAGAGAAEAVRRKQARASATKPWREREGEEDISVVVTSAN